MKFSIFIGHHKTGSTSVQAHFARHRLDYLRRGVLYPMVEGQGMATLLAEALAGEGMDARTSGLNLREPHNALAFRLLQEAGGIPVPPWHPHLPSSHQMFRTIAMQISMLRPEHVVLCSEVMSRLPMEWGDKIMPRLSSNFGAHDLTLVMNLRRPDHYITSWHMQRMKFGHGLQPLRHGAWEEYRPGAHFQYEQVLAGYQAAFPQARLILRNYDLVRASGGSVGDFLGQIGLDPGAPVEEVKANGSVPHALCEVNRLLTLKAPGVVHAFVDHVRRAAGRLALPPSDEVEMFGPLQRATMVEAFAPIHEALSARVGAPFFPDIDDMARLRPIPEIEAARIGLAAIKADIAEYGDHDGLKGAMAEMELEAEFA